ncbi:angiogenic factor with G patch and FHA domains 1 isoform X1 [Drosophila grimshawi]|uniref:angiogenic factor with G patch and FHA domains 1 isoform X1 n=1 Tax=Drosophila grimshawi TaxID=7222 RepID=UPI000C86F0FB|nr:angiogenic factor with G patch and FHA domains 1 isoform X1 [Drosophila grimshawi]XP_032589930.1 angiogenic factor with G patch and FHA domains 1 isoform X1 [Drosophila grimshawi]
MSTAEPDAGQASTGEDSTHDYIDLKSMDDVEALEKKQLYTYIEKLHGIIRKYDTKIALYKHKLKHFLNKEKCTEVTTDDKQANNERPNGRGEAEETSKELSATDAFSFVDEMRQAAKHAENLNNFVYEPTSGMYYDPKTGYYYNAEYGLYYDGNTGCYYSYDQAKDSYEFHSQAQVQANSATGKGETGSKQLADDDGQDDDVEFDEYGGVITDKDTLQQIKTEKQLLKDRAEKSKRKAKKKHKKKKKKENRHKSKKRHKNRDSDNSDNDNSRKRSRKSYDVEDGELSQSSSSSSSKSSYADGSNSDSSVVHFKVSSRFQDIAKKYPPSLRIIVQETNVQELTVGSLHLITYKGGSLGREGAHDVIIPDVNVSKSHLNFHYDTKQGVYKCRDLGSRNGTVLNGVRMSESKEASETQDLVHGSVIGIGQTRLLCHVHEGNSTCGLCEPGLLIETQTAASAATTTNANVLTHKEQLKKLQKKYGLENEKFVEASGNVNHNYNDRSAQRRIKVGSSTDKEKTEVACVNTEISSSNKGFKMLSKLGWQKGETLGKTNQGLLTPINVVANEGTTGLGSSEPLASTAPRPVDKRKLANLKITQARYERAKDIFELTDESD